jgi:erythromycin esterase-like protein
MRTCATLLCIATAIIGCGGPSTRATAAAAGDDASGGQTATIDAGIDGTITDDASIDAGVDAPTDALPALASGMYALAGVDLTMPDDDLTPLLGIVGGATTVGLGESVHTSGGFEAIKARIVRFLVERAGYRVLAFETPRSNARAVAAPYVATCGGTATDAAKGINAVFDADTTGALLAWMCAWNQSHAADAVSLYGFDVQQPWTDWDELRAWLTKAAPSDSASRLAALAKCDGPQATSEDDYWANHYQKDPFPQASYDACIQGLDALDAYVAAHATAMTKATSAEAYAIGKLSALGLRSWQGEYFYLTSDERESYEARDVAMATVYETLRALYFPSAKAILWAHNYHLMKGHDVASDPTGVPSARSMGGLLAKDLGAAYAPIGLSGNDVEIDWPNVGNGPTNTPSAGSIEATLHALGRPWLLVDLESAGVASTIPPGQSLLYGNPWEMGIVAADQWRAIVYFETSPPMKALFW